VQVISLVWGVFAALGMLLGFIPLLGWFNWLNIPFAAVGLIVAALTVAGVRPPNNRMALAGLVLCAVACVAGSIRLCMGWGII
jgi:hypothetical protein